MLVFFTAYLSALYLLRLVHVSGGSGEVARGTLGPPYFSTKMRPEGPKKIFLETAPPPPPPLSEGLDPPLTVRA